MGQSLKKLAPGSEGKTMEKVGRIVDNFYEEKFKDPNKKWENSAEFYIAVCEAVEEINRSFGNTQFRVPKTEALERIFNNHHKMKEKAVTKEEFRKMLEDVIMETGVTGVGAKDILLYTFGVPITALFIKQRLIPHAIPNEIFIPGVTSATVFVLAKLNKL